MKIKIYQKKFKKTKDHDGFELINPKFSIGIDRAFKQKTEYPKDNYGRPIGITKETQSLDLKILKKEFPKCGKVVINGLSIYL
jgi:hypothetical protein